MLVPDSSPFNSTLDGHHVSLRQIETDILEVQDNLRLAKLHQALQADKHQGPEDLYNVGDLIMHATLNRRRDYMQRGGHHVAKFMVRYDGPYKALTSHLDTSTYMLDVPPTSNIFSTVHSSDLKCFIPNDDECYPSRKHERPGPIVGKFRKEKWHINALLD